MKPDTCLGVYVLLCYIQVVNSYCRFGFTLEKVTPDYFQVSYLMFMNPIMYLSSYQMEVHKLRVLAEGYDRRIFL